MKKALAAVALALILASCANTAANNAAPQSAQMPMTGDNRLNGPNGNTDPFGGVGQ